ncbi:hypothetical protein Tco_1491137 [Tanacetum coccineum]
MQLSLQSAQVRKTSGFFFIIFAILSSSVVEGTIHLQCCDGSVFGVAIEFEDWDELEPSLRQMQELAKSVVFSKRYVWKKTLHKRMVRLGKSELQILWQRKGKVKEATKAELKRFGERASDKKLLIGKRFVDIDAQSTKNRKKESVKRKWENEGKQIIIKKARKGVYQIVRENGTDSFIDACGGAMLKGNIQEKINIVLLLDCDERDMVQRVGKDDYVEGVFGKT